MKKIWETRDFEAFRAGTFGNGGQNLYVSKRGILQRIFQNDLNHNGYFDLVFPNTQNHNEAMPSYLYRHDGSCLELPGQGGADGLAEDLNGNGYIDLVLANYCDAANPFASADIYWGSAEGYGEKMHTRLPAPYAKSVACGRFNSDKKLSLAFSMPCYKLVRIFYPTDLGCYEWMRYVDLEIDCEMIGAGDLDGDGFDELIVRKNESSAMTIYWGGEDGINLKRCTQIPELPANECNFKKVPDYPKIASGFKFDPKRLVQIVELQGKKYLSCITGEKVVFYTAQDKHNIERGFELEMPYASSVIAGDINGDGIEEIIVSGAFESPCGSRIYWGSEDGTYNEGNITNIPTENAVDASIRRDNSVIFIQGAVGRSYTAPALTFSFDSNRKAILTGSLKGEFAKRGFAINNPGCEEEIYIVNTYSRSAVGAEESFIYWGDADGFSPERMTPVPCCCAVDTVSADINDDGWAELIVCNNAEEALHLNAGHHIHYFNTEGFDPKRSKILPNNLGWAATVADFNHDGILEIATVGDNYDSIKIFRCLEDGFEELYSVPLNCDRHARWLVAVDLNLNGYLDLVVPCNLYERSRILWGGADGFSIERSTELAVYQGACARCADLNGNGYPDLIIGTHTDLPQNGDLKPRQPQHSFLHIYWNGPEGISEFRKTVLRSDASDSIAIGDFNGNGELDIFCGSYHAGKDRDSMSYLYWNHGGMFHEMDRKMLYTHSASGCIACDFNEDGFLDLAVANHKYWGNHSFESEIWWNSAGGFDHKNTTKLPTQGPHGLSAVEPGNQLDRSSEEFYTSTVSEIEECIITGWEAEGELPPKTWVKIRFQRAEAMEALENSSWSEWYEQGDVWFGVKGNFVRYQLALGAINGLRSPRITAIKVYLQK
jgi:hypothetical protein